MIQFLRGWRGGVYTVHCSITPVCLLSSEVMLVLTPFNYWGDPAVGVGGMKCGRDTPSPCIMYRIVSV